MLAIARSPDTASPLDVWQLLSDRGAGLVRLQQGQHRDGDRHRPGLRQEAGANALPRGDESLGLAKGAGPSVTTT